MKKVLLALGVLLSLTIVVIAGGIIYIANFDPNENKDWLAQKFNEATGRDLTLGGDVGLTIYPWLGVTLNDATISNAPDFSNTPMLQAQHAEVRIKLLPLLRSEYEIDTVRLQGVKLNLEVAGDGRTNWQDLSAEPSSENTEAEIAGDQGPAVKNIILGGVTIEDTSLIYDNQFNNTHYEISNLAMTIGELIYGAPLDVALSMDLLSRNPQLASKANLAGTVTYDVDNGLYNLNPLTLNASLSGPDVPSGSTNLSLSTALSMNLDEDTLTLDKLIVDALGTHVTANMNASRVQTDEPAVKASINVAGENLAAIFRILEQDELAQRIASLNNTFNMTASIDADLNTGALMVPDLQVALLGAEITSDLHATAINTSEPAMSGNLRATGPDLPTLVEVIGILQGGNNARVSQIGRDLARVPDKNFSVQTRFDADMNSGAMNVPEFSVTMFGAAIDGTLSGSRINTETPALQGNLAAKGPNLPLLMQIAGQLQGGTQASLNQYGLQLRTLTDKSFTLTTNFNADLEQGDIQIPAINAQALGFNLNGNMDAKNMQANNASINGELALTGTKLREVFTAIDQADLAEVAQSIKLDLSVSGSNKIAINPLRLDLVVAGNQIANSPQTISLNANTVMNLDDDSIEVENFSLNGLGLNMSGNLSANNISENLTYTGKLAVPEFNARNFLQQLNQPMPETSDAAVLKKLAMNMDFNGTSNSAEIEKLTVALDDTTLKGTFAIQDFAKQTTRFTLDIDAIDADRYLPAEATTATPTQSAESAPLEVDALKTLDVQGSINIGALTMSGLQMKDIVVAVNAAGGELALNPVSASLYDGSFKSDMLLNVNGAEPTATVNTTLSGINLGPLLQDFMDATYLTGKGNIQLGLAGRGADITSIKRNLNGSGSIKLEDGVLEGVDVSGVLGSIETMIRSKRIGSLPQGGQTAFNNFSATLDIHNGVVNSNDLLIEAPGWKVNGAGTLVDLGNDSINYNLVATVEPSTATSNAETFDIGGYSLPIACKGNINSPSCLPDAKQILTAAVGNEVQRRLGDFLKDRLGGGAQ